MKSPAELEYGSDGLPVGWPDDQGVKSSGEAVAIWCETVLVQPDGQRAGDPWRFTDSQARFVAWFYALDDQGEFLWRRAQACLPKGSGKSPMGAALACAEFAGPVVFGHWDADGEPVMKPQSSPYVSLSALSLGQAQDATMSLARQMLDNPVARTAIPELDLGLLRIRQKAGQLIPATAGVDSKEGIRLSFALLDESHLWTTSNRGTNLATKLRLNLAKTNSRSLETTNRWEIGAGSVAEQTASYAAAVAAGQHRGDGVLIWAPTAHCEDLSNDVELRAALEELYFDSPWIRVDRLIEEIRDGSTSPANARRYFLNTATSHDDAFLPAHAWTGAHDAGKSLQPGDLIALGFDGSRGRGQGMADATALVAVRIADGFVKTLLVDQQEPGQTGWEPDVAAVNAAVADAFTNYKVRGFFADPAYWFGELAEWEATYGRRVRVKAGRTPFAWPTNRTQAVADAFETLYQAVIDGELTHDGNPLLLEHGLNARRVHVGGNRFGVAKEFDRSHRKIDLIWATMLAWEARRACRADGLTGKPRGRGRVILL